MYHVHCCCCACLVIVIGVCTFHMTILGWYNYSIIIWLRNCTFSQIDQTKASAESDRLASESVLIRSQRRIEAELHALTSGGNIPEAVGIEVSRRTEAELKLVAAKEKCNELIDKCDVRFMYIRANPFFDTKIQHWVCIMHTHGACAATRYN